MRIIEIYLFLLIINIFYVMRSFRLTDNWQTRRKGCSYIEYFSSKYRMNLFFFLVYCVYKFHNVNSRTERFTLIDSVRGRLIPYRWGIPFALAINNSLRKWHCNKALKRRQRQNIKRYNVTSRKSKHPYAHIPPLPHYRSPPLSLSLSHSGLCCVRLCLQAWPLGRQCLMHRFIMWP